MKCNSKKQIILKKFFHYETQVFYHQLVRLRHFNETVIIISKFNYFEEWGVAFWQFVIHHLGRGVVKGDLAKVTKYLYFS